ncbi:ribosomal protein L7/L12 [Afifella sp. IM 167]|uniref:ribosomal protein L7/L12 n=1 Tax=Afifella sp. IM 167 TaxID=2033586 RepID=UPI001CCB34A2
MVDVVLTRAGRSKPAVIKQLRAAAGLSVREAMALVGDAPKVIGSRLERPKAEELKKRLEWAGASVELR